MSMCTSLHMLTAQVTLNLDAGASTRRPAVLFSPSRPHQMHPWLHVASRGCLQLSPRTRTIANSQPPATQRTDFPRCSRRHHHTSSNPSPLAPWTSRRRKPTRSLTGRKDLSFPLHIITGPLPAFFSSPCVCLERVWRLQWVTWAYCVRSAVMMKKRSRQLHSAGLARFVGVK
jgi:hypothetical protein